MAITIRNEKENVMANGTFVNLPQSERRKMVTEIIPPIRWWRGVARPGYSAR